MLLDLDNKSPQVPQNCFIADSADVIGDVTLGNDCSVWFQAVLRADNDAITIGEGTNIQDGVIIHVDPGFPCRIGQRCVVGHRAVLHGCSVGNEVLIGIGAIILNGAHIPDGCLVGAGALVTENKVLEAGHLYMGVPAKKIRKLTAEERNGIIRNTQGYIIRARAYKKNSTP